MPASVELKQKQPRISLGASVSASKFTPRYRAGYLSASPSVFHYATPPVSRSASPRPDDGSQSAGRYMVADPLDTESNRLVNER